MGDECRELHRLQTRIADRTAAAIGGVVLWFAAGRCDRLERHFADAWPGAVSAGRDRSIDSGHAAAHVAGVLVPHRCCGCDWLSAVVLLGVRVASMAACGGNRGVRANVDFGPGAGIRLADCAWQRGHSQHLADERWLDSRACANDAQWVCRGRWHGAFHGAICSLSAVFEHAPNRPAHAACSTRFGRRRPAHLLGRAGPADTARTAWCLSDRVRVLPWLFHHTGHSWRRTDPHDRRICLSADVPDQQLGSRCSVERRAAGVHRADGRAPDVGEPRQQTGPLKWMPKMDAKHTGHMSRSMAVFAIGFLLFPLLAVVPVSFTSKRYLSMPEGHWSLRHYAALFSSSDWMSSIVQSVLVAACASVIATVLAVTFSVGVWYVRSRIATAMVALVLVPMVIPPVISAMGLYFMETKLGSWMRSAGYDTLPGVVIAHIVVITPYCVVTMLVALSPLDRRIELAARNLGAGLAQTTFMVVFPNLQFAISSPFFLGLALSGEEISVTLFVTSVNVNTVPRHIWTDLRDNISPGVAAISVLLLALTTAVLLGRMAVQHLAARRQTTH